MALRVEVTCQRLDRENEPVSVGHQHRRAALRAHAHMPIKPT
jgi:hypothetical protein